MELDDVKILLKTRIFKILLLLFALWLAFFIYFLLAISNDTTKQPGNPANFFRDLIWIIYWRWNLDYLMLSLWALIIFLECFLIRKSGKFISKEKLSIWISPAIAMGFSFLYMFAIDLGVTYMADTGFNGTWESTEVLWMGFTARELYHNFFFWLIPIIIFNASINQIMIYRDSYKSSFKAWFHMMAIYSLNLGFLDPLVCMVLWNDWRLFGNWAMGGADPIWAEGWILHYIIFAIAWWTGTYIIEKVRAELLKQKSKTQLNH